MEKMLTVVHQACNMLLFSWAANYLCTTLLTPRIGTRAAFHLTRLCWFALLVVFAMIVGVVEDSLFSIIKVTTYIMFGFIVYKGTARKKIITSVTLICLMFAAESICLLIVKVNGIPLESVNEKMNIFQGMSKWINLFDFFPSLFVATGTFVFRSLYAAKIEKVGRFRPMGSIFSLLVVALIYFTLLYAGYGLIKSPDAGTLIVASFFGINITAVCSQIGYVSRAICARNELKRLKQNRLEIEFELDAGKEMRRHSYEIYCIEHDMKNHIAVIETLNMCENYERIAAYANELIKQIDTKEITNIELGSSTEEVTK